MNERRTTRQFVLCVTWVVLPSTIKVWVFEWGQGGRAIVFNEFGGPYKRAIEAIAFRARLRIGIVYVANQRKWSVR
jgi:hypothetical protein